MALPSNFIKPNKIAWWYNFQVAFYTSSTLSPYWKCSSTGCCQRQRLWRRSLQKNLSAFLVRPQDLSLDLTTPPPPPPASLSVLPSKKICHSIYSTSQHITHFNYLLHHQFAFVKQCEGEEKEGKRGKLGRICPYQQKASLSSLKLQTPRLTHLFRWPPPHPPSRDLPVSACDGIKIVLRSREFFAFFLSGSCILALIVQKLLHFHRYGNLAKETQHKILRLNKLWGEIRSSCGALF